jgi:hypothetical protein
MFAVFGGTSSMRRTNCRKESNEMNTIPIELVRKPPLTYFPPASDSTGRVLPPPARRRSRRDVLRLLVGSDSRPVPPPLKRRVK